MNRIWKFLIGSVAVAIAVYSCSSIMHPLVAVNYRMSFEAMTPDGPKSGSGVIQVTYASQFNLNGGGRKGDVGVFGEAVPIDLGQGKILFVTLTRGYSGRETGDPTTLNYAQDAAWLPIRVFDFNWHWGEEYNLVKQVNSAKVIGSKEVPFKALPTTVTFKDINVPLSVELVQPDDLEATFGQGYKLTKATIQLTDDPPTNTIKGILVWLDNLKGGYLHGGFTSSGSPYGLTGLAFKSEGLSP
jgi:hypothetical protein